MPMFKVTATENIPLYSRSDDRPCNPFLVRDIFRLPSVKRRARVWEFEAENEADVRRLFKEAQDSGIENVRGFSLANVELI